MSKLIARILNKFKIKVIINSGLYNHISLYSAYPLHKNFRASASQALQKAVKKGRVFRIGTVYKINPNYRPVKVFTTVDTKDI